VRVCRTYISLLQLLPDRPASVAMQWVPDGGKRRRGRPSKTWRQTFQEDLQAMRVSWSAVHRVASEKASSPNAAVGVKSK